MAGHHPILTRDERTLLEAIRTGRCHYVVMDQPEAIYRLGELAETPNGIGPVRVIPRQYRVMASQVDSGPLATVESFAELTVRRLNELLPRERGG